MSPLARKLRKAISELGRGIGIAKESGARSGLTFLWEEVIKNSGVRVRALASGSRGAVECNLCGWRGPRFLTHFAGQYMDRNCFCPRCHSYPRHRGFAWLLQDALGGELGPIERSDKARLMFAPESGMLSLLSKYLTRMEGADLFQINEHVTRLEDLQSLTLSDESVAFVSCFHVLEHVPKDRLALSELHRVLAPEGLLVLCVPISFGRQISIDFGGPNKAMNDHCFDYGEDFPERLLEAGFSGTSYQLLDTIPENLHFKLGVVRELIFVLRRTPAGKAASITSG